MNALTPFTLGTEHNAWLVSAAQKRFADAVNHRRFAHQMRRAGMPGKFKDWMREAQRSLRMAKHYARKAAEQ